MKNKNLQTEPEACYFPVNGYLFEVLRNCTKIKLPLLFSQEKMFGYSGFIQVLFGLAAPGITFGIGKLINCIT